jgi:hypothetical protein
LKPTANSIAPPLIVPAALDDAGLDVYEFRALAHIARRSGSSGLYYGSGTRSAAICRMSLRTWRSAIASLMRRGLLEVVEKADGKQTIYRCTSCTGAPPAPVISKATGASPARGGAPGAGVPVHEVHGTGAPGAHKGEPEGVPQKETLKGNPPSPLVLVPAVEATDAWPESWLAVACLDWRRRYDGAPPEKRIGQALAKLKKLDFTWPDLRRGWCAYLRQTQGAFASPEKFASTAGDWVGTTAAVRPLSPAAERRRENLRAGLLAVKGTLALKAGDDA